MEKRNGELVQTPNEFYREKWRGLICSKLYMAFLISIIISVVVGFIGAGKIVSTQLAMIPLWPEMLGVVAVEAVISVPLVVSVMVIGAGLLLVRLLVNSNGKGQGVGIGILFWYYLTLFAITIIGFVVTLPAFTEWIPYQEVFGQPLQIVYCIYIFAGIEFALTLAVLAKMRANVWFWEGSLGPATALAVIFILRTLMFTVGAVVLSFFSIGLAALVLLFTVPMVLLIVLLFRYRMLMSKQKI